MEINPVIEWAPDVPGTLAYYASLLEDDTTEITMYFTDDVWSLIVSTPENAMKLSFEGDV